MDCSPPGLPLRPRQVNKYISETDRQHSRNKILLHTQVTILLNHWMDMGPFRNPLPVAWASLVAQLVKNPPAMQETPVEKIPWRRDRLLIPVFLGFPGGSEGKDSACNAGDLGLIPGLGRFPWRKAWQPTPVFSPGESHGGLQSTGSQRAGHDGATKHSTQFIFYLEKP